MGFFKSLAPTLVTGGLNVLGGMLSNQGAQASAREQMAFQERMSGSSHQREVQDLLAAGLNPALSANSGASTPVGASSTPQNIMGGAAAAASSAKSIEESSSRIANNRAQLQVQDAQRDAATASAKAAAANARNTDAETYRIDMDNSWIRNNPLWFEMKKSMELVAPLLSGARDLSSTFRNFKGYIPDRGGKKSDSFMDFEDMPNVRR